MDRPVGVPVNVPNPLNLTIGIQYHTHFMMILKPQISHHGGMCPQSRLLWSLRQADCATKAFEEGLGSVARSTPLPPQSKLWLCLGKQGKKEAQKRHIKNVLEWLRRVYLWLVLTRAFV